MHTVVIPIKSVAATAVRENVVTVRLLALCPMLAVSVSVTSAATLGLLTMLVMTLAAVLVATIRGITPTAVRLPIFLTLVAMLVAVADICLEALMPQQHRALGIFLPLIITNCAVLARLEMFASRQPPLAAAVDGVVSGGGMTAILLALAAGRELLAYGGIGGWFSLGFYNGIPSALSPAGGFILFALMLAALRLLRAAGDDE